jgi:hypothetical protein
VSTRSAGDLAFPGIIAYRTRGGDRMKPASLIAAVIFGIIAIAHLLRFAFHTEVIVGGTVIPMWISALGCVVAAVLSILVFREARSQPS